MFLHKHTCQLSWEKWESQWESCCENSLKLFSHIKNAHWQTTSLPMFFAQAHLCVSTNFGDYLFSQTGLYFPEMPVALPPVCQGLRCLCHDHHPLHFPPPPLHKDSSLVCSPPCHLSLSLSLTHTCTSAHKHTNTHTHPLFSSSPPFELIWPRGDQQRRVCAGGGRDGVSLSEGDNAAATARSPSQATFHSLFARLS